MAETQETDCTLRLTELCELLRERLPELERATLARVYGISNPASVENPEYVSGLRAAVSAGLAYGVAGIEASAGHPPLVPLQLRSQARLAARNGVSLNTILRRYFAGYVLLGDVLIDEAEKGGSAFTGSELRRALRVKAALFDGLITTIADEYAKEIEGRTRNAEQRRAELVKALLHGDFINTAALRYELDAWHLGLLATGPDAREALHRLGVSFDRETLLIQPDGEAIWAWLGGRRKLEADEVRRLASSHLPASVTVAIGESGQGLDGWRLTHRQARAALPIAIHGSENIVRYAEVTLLASVMSDDVVASSLEALFLAPLEQGRDGGDVLCRTLRAYFAADRNVSSTAAALGVSRPTIGSRLGVIEERIGRPLATCAAEVETALRLQQLRRSAQLGTI